MRRRRFLRVAGTAAVGLAAAGCGPEGTRTHTGSVTDDEPSLAEDRWVRSVCTLCAGGCGIQVRLVNERAVKIEGDPSHPVNRGGLCARGQAGLQVLYNPDRTAGPLRRTGRRGENRWERISWDAAINQLRGELFSKPGPGHSPLLFLTDRMHGHRQAAVDRFLRHAGSPAATICEVFSEEPVRRAAGHAFGQYGLPGFDLDRCATLLSVGASFIESGPSPVSFQRGLSVMRSRPGEDRGHFVHVEPRYSLTAAAADQWIPARPGTEGALLLALAHVLVGEKLIDEPFIRRSTLGFRPEDWSSLSPAEAAGITDVGEETIVGLARRLSSRKPATVLFGGSASGYTNSVAAARAATVVNALLGAYAAPPGGVVLPGVAPPGAGPSRLADAGLVQRIASGHARAILVSGADPVHLRPALRKIMESGETVPLLISFSPFMDETAALSDWILPDLTYLERFQAGIPEGSANPGASAAWFAPVTSPAADARSLVDILIGLAPEAFEHGSEEEVVAAWGQALPETGPKPPPADAVFEFPEGGIDFQRPRFERYSAEHPLVLAAYPSLALQDGSASNLPWLQELEDPMTGLRWGSHVEMHPRDARALQVGDGDRVTVGSERGRIEALLRLSETVMPGTLAAPAGQGHLAFGRYAEHRGANVFELLEDAENEEGGWAWGATRVGVSKPRRRRS